ncbi:11056_t:CDS:2 [Ambispora gerdemannii]|uniref:11056_t:CDS:1 n=1 Tax=Ambispora gerdemannii TaxID=144530 RepID=A0A9N9HBP1_9GLOM|nr:11056_t:CDS:2 [Ambispora gerdemannii]
MYSLPTEILQQVFAETLYTEKTYTTRELYSCILVNRQWCMTGIPILWSHPFHPDSRILQQAKLVDIYLSFFMTRNCPEEIASQPLFKEQQQNQLYHKIKSIENTNDSVFVYPYFANTIDFNRMIKTVQLWCILNRITDEIFWDIIAGILIIMQSNAAIVDRITWPIEAYEGVKLLKILKRYPEIAAWLSHVSSIRLMLGNFFGSFMDSQTEHLNVAELPQTLKQLEIDVTKINHFKRHEQLTTFLEITKKFECLKYIKITGPFHEIELLVDALRPSAATLLDISFTKLNCSHYIGLYDLLEFPNILELSVCGWTESPNNFLSFLSEVKDRNWVITPKYFSIREKLNNDELHFDFRFEKNSGVL